MTGHKTVQRLFWLSLLLVMWAVTGCGNSKDSAETEAPAEAAVEEEPILNVDEQRALRAEADIEADEKISEDNFDEALEALKKEIEEDL